MNRSETLLVSGSSVDGKISPGLNISSKLFGKYISEEVNKRLHIIRSKCDGILISSNTALSDNPSLTVRGVDSNKKPVRIIIDTKGMVKGTLSVCDGKSKTLILTSSKGYKKLNKLNSKNIEIIICKEKKGGLDLKDCLEKTYSKGIKNIIIEGGGKLNKSFFEEKLIDKIIQFRFPFIVGGKDTPTMVDGIEPFNPDSFIKLSLKNTEIIENTIISEYETC